MTKKLLMGNEAMAYAALEAGVRVVAGYPGTPSSEIVETVAKLHAAGSAHGVHVEWSTNEKVALELLFGASLAGARSLFTCKQMGLNVASDALMSLNYVSVRGGLVLVVADDPGPISSQTEQDTRRFAAFAKVPVLDPSTPEQAYSMIQAAFELSERFHTPVIVRPTTRVDHASAFFEVPDETFARGVPESGFERDVSKWVIFPRRAFQAHGEINERLAQMAQAFSSEEPYCGFNQVLNHPEEQPDGASFGIVAGGISSSYVREALRMVEERVARAGISMPAYRFMQVGTPYPFPTELVARFAEGLSEILVIEELDYVIEDELARLAGRAHASFNVSGKLTGAARDRGENDVDDIVVRIEKFLGLAGRLRLHLHDQDEAAAFTSVTYENAADLPVRPPVLCPGCPHRGSFYAVKQALRKVPAVMCGDIGCYTLGNAQPLDVVDTCLCMGAGITMAQGFAVADPEKKAIAYIGDSTFFASGMTGLANAAYNGHDITVMVLDNATTAMTGSQPHPGTGYTLMGDRNEPLSIEAILVANGFSHVYHANPLDKDASIIAVKAAVAYEGPSAVIFESPCIQLIKPDEPVSVNPDVCTGCKKCITEIGCPGIGFDLARRGPRSGERGQAFIDPMQCNGCDLCVQVCPFKAIVFPIPDADIEEIDEDVVFRIVEDALEDEGEFGDASDYEDEDEGAEAEEAASSGKIADLSGFDEMVEIYNLDDEPFVLDLESGSVEPIVPYEKTELDEAEEPADVEPAAKGEPVEAELGLSDEFVEKGEFPAAESEDEETDISDKSDNEPAPLDEPIEEAAPLDEPAEREGAPVAEPVEPKVALPSDSAEEEPPVVDESNSLDGLVTMALDPADLEIENDDAVSPATNARADSRPPVDEAALTRRLIIEAEEEGMNISLDERGQDA